LKFLRKPVEIEVAKVKEEFIMGIITNSLTSAYYCARRGVQIVKKQSNYMKGLHAFTCLFSQALFSQKDITINVKNREINYDGYIPDFCRSVLPKGITQALENRQIDVVQIRVKSTVEDSCPDGTIKYLLRNSFRALALHGIKDMSIEYNLANQSVTGLNFFVDGVAQISQALGVENGIVIDIEISQRN